MKVIVCDTYEKQIKGVIGNRKFPKDTIYVFPDTKPNSMFHMATVPFPLDIAYLDANDNILLVVTMPPEYGLSKAPLKTAKAVEAPVGFFDKYQSDQKLPLKELEDAK